MKILFLSQLVPYPPDAGPKVRSYYVLQHLARQHEVTLLAFRREEDQPESLDHLRSICQEVHTVLLHRSRLQDVRLMLESILLNRSFIIHRDQQREMSQLVAERLRREDFDVVHADQLWMAEYALQARRQSPRLKLVLDEHNACFQVFQRLAAGERKPVERLALEREWRMLQHYEIRVLPRFDRVVTVTKEDSATLSRSLKLTATPPNFTTIPICVNTNSVRQVQPQPGARDVLHLGTMFWMPNVEGVLWFGRQIWPAIAQQVPGSVFTIVGKGPPQAVRSLTGQPVNVRQVAHHSEEMPRPRVVVTGYQANPRSYLEQAGVFIVPLLSGGGMRVKILDAWSWGLPVVSTSMGAEGIQYRDGENIMIADTPQAFINAVVRVLQDPDLANRLRYNGRRWVEEHYDWHHVYRAWDEVYAF